jgi:hypothetical protein
VLAFRGASAAVAAGHGIVHSEMPQPTATPELWGLQLWVNLPAARKLIAPRYQDLAATAIPTALAGDASVRVIAGRAGGARGPVDGIDAAPTMLDATVPAGGQLVHEVAGGHAAFVYVLDGEVAIGARATSAAAGQLAVLAPGTEVRLASAAGGRALLLAAAPIGEPVARRGPFVMNTQAELDQAFADYRSGRLTRP